MMMVICPNSTPKLKEINAVIKCVCGIPISFNADAKPIPCINPKRKMMVSRQLFTLSCTIFSMEVNSIDNAIRGSMILELGSIYPDAAKPSEMLWASVKMVH